MRVFNDLVINALPANANQNSTVIWAQNCVRISAQLSISSGGTAAGNIQLQGSNDFPSGLPNNQFVPTNWSNIGSAATVSSGIAMISEVETSYEYLRIVYTDTSGATALGTISVRAKGVLF